MVAEVKLVVVQLVAIQGVVVYSQTIAPLWPVTWRVAVCPGQIGVGLVTEATPGLAPALSVKVTGVEIAGGQEPLVTTTR
jgi:hypothetical protein